MIALRPRHPNSIDGPESSELLELAPIEANNALFARVASSELLIGLRRMKIMSCNSPLEFQFVSVMDVYLGIISAITIQ